ncbi:UNVERIFIED_CONTAM: hypothetical protein K2H54_051774 [Gekko kuhli]
MSTGANLLVRPGGGSPDAKGPGRRLWCFLLLLHLPEVAAEGVVEPEAEGLLLPGRSSAQPGLAPQLGDQQLQRSHPGLRLQVGGSPNAQHQA